MNHGSTSFHDALQFQVFNYISKHLIYSLKVTTTGHWSGYWLTSERTAPELNLPTAICRCRAESEFLCKPFHYSIRCYFRWSCALRHFVLLYYSLINVRHLILQEQQVVAIHCALELVAVITHIVHWLGFAYNDLIMNHSLTLPATPFCVDSITWNNNNTVLEEILSIAFSSFIHSSSSSPSSSGCCVYSCWCAVFGKVVTAFFCLLSRIVSVI